MIPTYPVYLIRRCDGPRGRGRRLVGYAQLEGSVILIEADAAGKGWRTRTRALPSGREDRIIELAEATTRRARRRAPGH